MDALARAALRGHDPTTISLNMIQLLKDNEEFIFGRKIC